jgi:hypothetical protein
MPPLSGIPVPNALKGKKKQRPQPLTPDVSSPCIKKRKNVDLFSHGTLAQGPAAAVPPVSPTSPTALQPPSRSSLPPPSVLVSCQGRRYRLPFQDRAAASSTVATPPPSTSPDRCRWVGKNTLTSISPIPNMHDRAHTDSILPDFSIPLLLPDSSPLTPRRPAIDYQGEVHQSNGIHMVFVSFFCRSWMGARTYFAG